MNEASVIAWDGPTRVFKWALVFVVLDGWISNRYGGSVPNWHKFNGYAALVLITFRVLWGFVGGSTARFANFFAAPGKVFVYLQAKTKFLGHNPLGGWMVVALLVLVAAMATTGLFSADEDRLIIEGPLAKTISDAMVDVAARWHRYIFTTIEVFVAVHVAANVIYAVAHREPLIEAMITGRKPADQYTDMPVATPGSWGQAAICLGVAAALVFGAISAAGGRPF
ncbi:cytochrome b [Rhodopseudomonas rhenobacensis]|uniref:Cytochrome b n=1 Tax=Rhodopseudomonas rhenobacensis TaxID=87461 RepID=A0A7W8DXV3_9BRAD|nr:cytochrome b/b6 domain-containing protein [Rhodopseudomonas rhenobacensis]MBB5046624.1 cytochrome b [Rhodopseudomonas rhenobacensis]